MPETQSVDLKYYSPLKEWMFCSYDLALKTLRNIYGVIYN
jgi:hypothetical protein